MTLTGTPDALGYDHSSPTHTWPKTGHYGVWAMQPGGSDGSVALIDGLGLVAGDRIVDLAPGTGETGLRATEENLYAWTGICRDAAEVDQLRAAVPSAVTRAQLGTPDATGLGDESATVVVSEGLLFGLPDHTKQAVIAEAARLLRPNGRLGLHELCVRDAGLSGESTSAIRTRLAAPENGGLFPITESEWRAGALAVLRHLGPRKGMALLGRARGGGAPGKHAEKVLAGQQGRFSAVIIIARRPYVGQLRRRAGGAARQP
jgi:ubiquinone/menaquinone biosynthesis C-methylase UbiE